MSLLLVPDIGPKTVELLLKKEIESIEDLISFYPNTYSTFNYNTLVGQFYINGIIKSHISSFKLGKGLVVIKFEIEVKNKVFKVVAFNQKHIPLKFNCDDEVTIYATFDDVKNSLILKKMTHGYEQRDIFPVYPKITGISNAKLNKIIINAIVLSSFGEEIKRHLKNLHNPLNLDDLSDALYFLKYHEFLGEYKKIIESRQKQNSYDNSFLKKLDRSLKKNIIKKLPYELTVDQNNIIDELISQGLTDKRTNQLVVGDVGSGKTIIALIIAYIYVKCGYQVAYLTPSVMLAAQVYNQMKDILLHETFLLTSETGKRDAKKIINTLNSSSNNIIIGTHSLLSEQLHFTNLGLVIIDEQHRFGVEQRTKIIDKNPTVDVLSLTATPIPRTLAKTLYGGMDVKRIKTPHFKGITKTILSNDINDLDYYVKKYSEYKVFIVVPVIDKVYDDAIYDMNTVKKMISSQYVNKCIGIITGRTKNKISELNNLDKYDIIISTSVIEVGIDLQEARCVFILNAEKYGVAQLHQLRGRIGRNNGFNECILHTLTTNKESLNRLQLLVDYDDGFEIAKYDLSNRGGGTLFGNKQSGNNSFKLFDLRTDLDIVQAVINDTGIDF